MLSLLFLGIFATGVIADRADDAYARYLDDYEEWRDRQTLLEYWLRRKHNQNMTVKVMHNAYKDKVAVHVKTVDGGHMVWVPPKDSLRRFETQETRAKFNSRLTQMENEYATNSNRAEIMEDAKQSGDNFYDSNDSEPRTESEYSDEDDSYVTKKDKDSNSKSEEISRFNPMIPRMSTPLFPRIELTKIDGTFAKQEELTSVSDDYELSAYEEEPRHTAVLPAKTTSEQYDEVSSYESEYKSPIAQKFVSEPQYDSYRTKPLRSGYRTQFTLTKPISNEDSRPKVAVFNNRRWGNPLVPTFMYEDIDIKKGSPYFT